MDKQQIKKQFETIYKQKPAHLFSCGGRFEILGNHTDHNHGKCIAATCDLQIVASVSKSDNDVVSFQSAGYPSSVVDLSELNNKQSEVGSSNALIRGVASYLVTNGYKVGGFNAYGDSSIFPGAGVSSSAAFELLIGRIFSYLYNDDKIPKLVLCKAGQYAENTFFGKASGLLDQIGVGYGNIVSIDFENINEPKIENIEFPFDDLKFVIINTGGSHADLSHLYSAIPNDMYSAAKKGGVNYLRETTLEKLNKCKLSENEYLKAKHFYGENERVDEAIKAIKSKDLQSFLEMINESRISSTNNLKNMSVDDQYEGSPLEACDYFNKITNGQGAIKINGGGFAGSVIAAIPKELVNLVTDKMGLKYGFNNVKVLNIRNDGPVLEE